MDCSPLKLSRCTWAPALAVWGLALKALDEHAAAAVQLAQALELSGGGNYRRDLEALLPLLSEGQRRALSQGGAPSLALLLDEEHQQTLPEIRRSRPKVHLT